MVHGEPILHSEEIRNVSMSIFSSSTSRPGETIRDLSECTPDSSVRDFNRSNSLQTGLLYMATRLYVNMSQVFIGLYLQKTLQLPKVSEEMIKFCAPIVRSALFPLVFQCRREFQRPVDTLQSSIAIIPLVMYVSGFVASFPINLVAKKLKLRVSEQLY